jgi:enamine deaminase RidA (YjgF/YER057c/UK114 family)
MDPEQRLRELKIDLGQVSSPVANYVNAVRTVEQAYQHARSVGIDLLAVMKAELGSLARVKRVVKVLGMVNSVPEFEDPPKVINGCSDLFVEVFGDRGRHARSAVGMAALPMGIPVEIECIVEVA